MRTLIGYEFKKLLGRKVLWVALALVMALTVYGFKYPMESKLQGRIQGMRDAIAPFDGQVFTDAIAAQARAMLIRYAADHPDDFETREPEPEENPEDVLPASRADYRSYSTGLWQILYNLGRTDFTVESRQARVESWEAQLDSGYFADGRKLTQADQKQIQQDIEYESHPAVVRYAAGWEEFNAAVQGPGMLLFILLIVGLTALFGSERNARMDNVLLCARARRQAIGAKMVVSAVYALSLCVVLFGLEIAAVALTYGLEGGQYPIRDLSFLYLNITSGSPYNVLPVSAPYPAALALTALAAMACSMLISLAASLFWHPLASLGAVGAVLLAQFLPATVSQYLWSMHNTQPGNVPQFMFVTQVTLPYADWPQAFLPAFQLYNIASVTSFADQPTVLGIFAAVSLAVCIAAVIATPRLFCRRRRA